MITYCFFSPGLYNCLGSVDIISQSSFVACHTAGDVNVPTKRSIISGCIHDGWMDRMVFKAKWVALGWGVFQAAPNWEVSLIIGILWLLHIKSNIVWLLLAITSTALSSSLLSKAFHSFWLTATKCTTAIEYQPPVYNVNNNTQPIPTQSNTHSYTCRSAYLCNIV